MSQAGTYDSGTPLADVETIQGDVGGPVGPDALGNINLLVDPTSPALITGNPGTNTLTLKVSGGGITWIRTNLAFDVLSPNSGYIPINALLTEFVLPTVATVGDTYEIAGETAGLWFISQNAGQNIQFGTHSTTVGIAGSLSASNRYDCVRIICRVANTTFQVVSNIGILNVV